MISKLWASSCWGFLQIIPFWLSHPSAGRVWLTSSQLVLRCNPCSRSTIIKSYLPFRGKAFCISLLCRSWGLLFVPPARSHSWASWKFHVCPSVHGIGLLLPFPRVPNSMSVKPSGLLEVTSTCIPVLSSCRRHQTPVAQNKTQIAAIGINAVWRIELLGVLSWLEFIFNFNNSV